MWFCPKCGNRNEIDGGFCTGCGSPFPGGGHVIKKDKKKLNIGLIIGIAVAVIIAAVIVILAVTGTFGKIFSKAPEAITIKYEGDETRKLSFDFFDYKGEELEFTAVFEPEDAKGEVIWSTDDEDEEVISIVETDDKICVIELVGGGKAKLTATCGEVEAKVKIEVIATRDDVIGVLNGVTFSINGTDFITDNIDTDNHMVRDDEIEIDFYGDYAGLPDSDGWLELTDLSEEYDSLSELDGYVISYLDNDIVDYYDKVMYVVKDSSFTDPAGNEWTLYGYVGFDDYGGGDTDYEMEIIMYCEIDGIIYAVDLDYEAYDDSITESQVQSAYDTCLASMKTIMAQKIS